MKNNYEIIFLSESAIGNTLEILYAVEYCLKNEILVGLYLKNISGSFRDYLKSCYGDEVILSSLENIHTRHLVHPFFVESKIDISYENYIYINADKNSTQYMSETEQYLSIVRALYPSAYHSYTLEKLIASHTQRVEALEVQNKYILYPGSSSFASVKRWPSYLQLIEQIGNENIIIVGGLDDLNYDYSYVYKDFVTKIFPRPFTNRKSFWEVCKKLNMLKPFALNNGIENFENSYFNVFEWGELVAIFRHAKGFVGNDGGLMHLASAAGAKGVAIFGPSSVKKNRSYNPDVKEIYKNYSCQPCQFNVENISMSKFYISCPYQVKCLTDISCENVLDLLES